VPLNVDQGLSDDGTAGSVLPEVLEELNQISFRDFQGALKRWHQGTLSLIHLNVLMMLRFNGPQTMSRLAETLDVSVASATGIIDRMEHKGVIERRRNDDDRRVVEVHVTDEGLAVFSQIQAERQTRMSQMLSAVAESDLKALLRGLRAVRAAREEWLSKMPDREKQQG
jgi:DNA-binding MarR family transcriptional regulator